MPPSFEREGISPESLRQRILAYTPAQGGRYMDTAFADFLLRDTHSDCPWLWLAAYLCSDSVGKGHCFLPLDEPLRALSPDLHAELMPLLPELGLWRQALLASGQCAAAGEAGAALILDAQHRLYLARFYRFEQQVGARLKVLSQDTRHWPRERLQALLQQLFPPARAQSVDWQKVAVALALSNRFSIISGGPGTGKTYTVARLLAARIALQPETAPLRIALAAPTGKAAQRLSESLLKARHELQQSAPELAAQLPTQALTLHRLLGRRREQWQPRHHANNPLAVDLLLVDEASMVDLPQMSLILDALPESADLVLVGDKDQLPSVEVGNLMGDLCLQRRPQYPPAWAEHLSQLCAQSISGDGQQAFARCIALLRESRRFRGDSGIAELSRLVNRGQVTESLELLKHSQSTSDLHFYPAPGAGAEAELDRALMQWAHQLHRARQAHQALERLGQFRVLCATRRGRWGVEHLNARVRVFLGRRLGLGGNQLHYHGRPIMVSENDYENGLFNGDVGVIWQPDPQRPAVALFEQAGGEHQRVPISRLGAHESAYAMTIHKSQGSEFFHTALVLNSADPRMLNRELLYTGATRARALLSIWASDARIRQSVANRCQRQSALAAQLWDEAAIGD